MLCVLPFNEHVIVWLVCDASCNGICAVWFCVFSLIVCCSAFVCFVCDLLCDVVWLVFDSLCV